MATVSQHARAPWQVEAPQAPIAGESLDGYIARVAAANWIENALTITSLAGVIYGHKPTLSTSNWDGLPIIADCLRVDVEELQSRSYPTDSNGRRVFFGVPVPRNDIDIAVRRYAPAALSISPHHRALWQLRAFPFCCETWQYLVDRCARCERIQRWHHTNGIARCDRCVDDLFASAAAAVPSELRTNLSAAVGLVHTDVARRQRSLAVLPAVLQHLGVADVYELLVRVAIVIEPRLTPARYGTNASWSQPSCVVAEAMAAAWGMLLDWPHSLQGLIAKRLSSASTRHQDGNEGSTMRFLRLSTHEALTDALRQTIDQFRSAIDLDGPNSSQLGKQTLSTQEAAARLGYSTKGVAELRRQGALTTVFALHECRAAPRYDAAEIDTLAEIIANRVALEGAAWKLGISYHGVEQLIAMQMLLTQGDRFCVPRYGSPQIAGPVLDGLTGSIKASSRSVLASEGVSLRTAVGSVGGRAKPWGPIFKSLLDGSLPFKLDHRAGALAEQILVDHTCFRFLRSLFFDASSFEGAKFSSMLSRRDAGEVLNLSPKSSTPLFQRMAASENISKAVSFAEVVRLSEVHISSREIALRLGIAPKTAFARANEMMIPLLGPAGWCRETAESQLGLT
ncbi:hypothetical protein V6R86_06765 [Sphingomonas kaistensis]|uniref:TniQ protein n=1 Tax=Sphingomonas kaistensis TaxID=298708 RepID=A0ABZ2G3H3_9SPHN